MLVRASNLTWRSLSRLRFLRHRMANASAKRIAAQNEKAIWNLRIGMVLSSLLSLIIRQVFRRHAASTKSWILLYFLTLVPSIVLYIFLVRSGTPRRDGSGTLISPGDDLAQTGLIEWSWDIIYITWACQTGSSLFGEWVWWFYLIIPLYAGYKFWSYLISPMLLGQSSRLSGAGEEDTKQPTSKRQDKLLKRQEKGKLPVRTVAAKR